MASKKVVRGKGGQPLAVLVTGEKAPCAFCNRQVDDEITYGKLYAIGRIQCHYFCVLLSCCLIQKGEDEEGLFGFLYSDILAEIERSKKHKCSYCYKDGATLGCCISQCRKQFHLPCGRERNAVSLFYGNYKSYCKDHAPKQKIPEHIMAPARLRMKLRKKQGRNKNSNDLKEIKDSAEDNQTSTESVCVICYEEVDGFPTVQTFWPPCCARDAWFHRSCLQRMALSAGMHYLKCPLCNDKENFYQAVVDQGYYVPDRDAAWELEQNAFAEIYERPLSCSAKECKCPKGREYDSDTGLWDIKLCMLCGTTGQHAHCMSQENSLRFVCDTCTPAAPNDLDALAQSIEAVILQEQSRTLEQTRLGPIMPSRMSLRRTKGRIINRPSTSKTEDNTALSRSSLNLKTPKKPNMETKYLDPKVLQDLENRLLSPIKMVEQGLGEKIKKLGVESFKIDSEVVVNEMRRKLGKPKPLSEKKRIVNEILERLFDNTKENVKTKEPTKEWNSPKKVSPINEDLENHKENVSETENQENVTKNLKPQTPKKGCPLTFEDSPETLEFKTSKLEHSTVDNGDPKISDNNSDPKTPDSIISEGKSPDQNTLETNKSTSDNILDPKAAETTGSIISESKSPDKITLDSKTSKLSHKSTDNNILNPKTAETPDIIISESKSLDKISLETKKSKLNHTSDSILNPKTAGSENSNCNAPDPETSENISSERKLPHNIIFEEDSNSSFELPREFIAESNDSIYGSPRKKIVNIEKNSSLEISGNDEVVNIDLVKMDDNDLFDNLKKESPVKKESTIMFSPLDKETLKQPLQIDFQSFKNQYLNEVGRDFKCEFKHKHLDSNHEDAKFQSAIDFAIKASNDKDTGKKLKRKLERKDDVGKNRKKSNLEHEKRERQNGGKKRKLDKRTRKLKSSKVNVVYENNIEVICDNESVDLTVDTPKIKKKHLKNKKHKKARENLEVKIKWREKGLNLKITQSKKVELKNQNLKQYILNFPTKSNVNFIKPEQDVETPKRKKKIKTEKSPDNLVQTSIQSFFKTKP